MLGILGILGMLGPYIVVAEGLVAAGGGAGAVLPLVLRLLVQGDTVIYCDLYR